MLPVSSSSTDQRMLPVTVSPGAAKAALKMPIESEVQFSKMIAIG